jgi:hypothetical protein
LRGLPCYYRYRHHVGNTGNNEKWRIAAWLARKNLICKTYPLSKNR